MFTTKEQLLESLALFDRPERERLRNFLPRSADLDVLVQCLFEAYDGGPKP